MDLARELHPGPAPAERRALFLHGILGSGANLRTIARRFVGARPGWDALTVDLRGHGASPRSSPDPTLDAAARNVAALARGSEVPVALLAGHSFGGKVALAALRHAEVPRVVTIDSPPGAREPARGGDSALAVIEAVRALPRSFASRADLVAALRGRGFSPTLAGWLAMSTETVAGEVRLTFDVDEIEALVLDYFREDLWPLVESTAAAVSFVVGGRSDAWSPEERARARDLAARGRVTVDVLPTDHWVHVEDPDGLLAVLVR
jgi:esterase